MGKKIRAASLCGGNKAGKSERKFYRTLIALADERFNDWLEAEEG